MSTRIRLIFGAAAGLAAAGQSAGAQKVIAARSAVGRTIEAPVQREQETASWRSGDVIVWVRVAKSGAISVFASHGYRSAFAHPLGITADEADKWAEVGDRIAAGQAVAGSMALGDGDIILEPGRLGDSVVLNVRLGGTRPDAIAIDLGTVMLRDVGPALRNTARIARAAQAPQPVDPPPQAAAAAAPPAPRPGAPAAPSQPAPISAAGSPVAPPAPAAPAVPRAAAAISQPVSPPAAVSAAESPQAA